MVIILNLRNITTVMLLRLCIYFMLLHWLVGFHHGLDDSFIATLLIAPISDDLDTFDLPLLDPETNQPLLIKSEPMDDPMQTHYVLKESLPTLVPAPSRQTIEAKQTVHLKPKQEIIKIKLEPMLDYQLETSSIGMQKIL